MSLEDFQLIDNELFDNSIIKKRFFKSIPPTRLTNKSIRSKH